MEDFMGFCRGCLVKSDDPNDLLTYSEKTRRQFVYSTGLQVKKNDLFTFQLCKECYLNMKTSCQFKKRCRTSEKYFKNYLALKEAGDVENFCTFIKNIDNNAAQRFPFMPSYGYSAPERKLGEDDNVSTSTSIRNFMSDIMKGEEIPDTEETIIKEVLEEEKDLSDDSLDSQWLQDDESMDTDLNIFGFSPFSTPKPEETVWNYTPQNTYSESTPQETKKVLKVKPDTIDRNLERALQKGDKKECQLDDILQSSMSSNEQSNLKTPVTDVQACDEDDSESDIEEIVIDDSDGETDVFTKMDLLDQKAASEQAEEPKRKALNFYVDLEESDSEVNVDVIEDKKPQKLETHKTVKKTEPNTSKPTENEIRNKYCNRCDKKLYTLSALITHFREGHYKYLICDICQKSFTSKSNIIRHFVQHDRESTFTCKVCNEEVLELDRYKHRRLHVPRLNTYSCDICGYSTQNKSNYNTHVRRHEKKYVCSCEHCDRGFYTKSAYTNHVRLHTSRLCLKPYKCSFCGTRFKRSDYLCNHIRRQHIIDDKETKTFQCDLCSKTFKSKNNILNHFRNRTCPSFKRKMLSENGTNPTLNVMYVNLKKEDLTKSKIKKNKKRKKKRK